MSSVAEIDQSVANSCPSCSGEMDEWETICSLCRAAIEEQVMTPVPGAVAAKAAAAQAASVEAFPKITQPAIPPAATVQQPAVSVSSSGSSQPKLEPVSRWKHIVLAIAVLGGCALVAFGIWSFVIPK